MFPVVVSSSRMSLVLSLISLKAYVLDARKVRLYGENPSIQQTQSQYSSGELGWLDL